MFSTKIRDFILTNRMTRRIMLLTNNKIIPTALKLTIIILIFLASLFTTLFFTYPKFSTAIYSKISNKFLQVNQLSQEKFHEIKISGNQKVSDFKIIEIIRKCEVENKNSQNSYSIIHDMIDKIIDELPWIVNIKINRNLPNILNIQVEEFSPFAVWHNDNNKFLIDKSGNIIEFQEDADTEKLIELSGLNANIHAKSLFNLLTIDSSFSKKVFSATWVGNRRWDVRLQDGVIVKLPEENISYAWKKIVDIYSIPGSDIRLEIVDLRVNDKIFLKYKQK